MFRFSIIIKACTCWGILTVGSARGQQKVYWADLAGGKVRRADLNGSNVEDLVTGGFPYAVAVDYCAGKLYWTDVTSTSNKIFRASLDGSGTEELVTAGSASLQGIALDLVNGKMYWGDLAASTITRANLNGSNVETVVTGARPVGIALDVVAGKVYWAKSEAIQSYSRADMNGLDSNVETLVPNIPNVSGVALDLAAGKMYFTQATPGPAGTGSIRRADLNGSNQETLIPSIGKLPFEIDLDGAGKMYWTDLLNGKIRRANLNGSGVEEIVPTANPRGITVAPNFANFGNFSDRDSDGDGICNSSDPCPFDPANMQVGGQCIPTLSEWGMIAMATLVVLAGAVVVSKRRRAAV